MEQFNHKLTQFFSHLWPAEEKVLVFGEGRCERPAIMLIGEAPGEQETLMGRPFVGKAGKNLDAFLEGAGIRRDELYISNTVKFRPTRISDAGRTVNRPPTQEEIALFLPWLLKEIALVEPEYVVTLGNVPLKALTENDNTIGKMHGQFFQREGYLLYPLYHPASVIYNAALKETYASDLAKLAQSLHVDTNAAADI